MRTLAVLAVLAFALAGCSGGGSDTPAATASLSSSSTAPPPPPAPRTDTLHLLEGPAMTTVTPTGGDLRTPITGANGPPGGPGGQQPAGRWQHVVTTPTNVTAAEAHVWVDIKETMYDSRVEPAQPRCTWTLQLAVGADTEPIISCVNEGLGPINPGVKELVFTVILDGSIGLEANETVTLTLTRTAFSASANNAVDALSGSAEHDSRLVLKGLKEPVKA